MFRLESFDFELYNRLISLVHMIQLDSFTIEAQDNALAEVSIPENLDLLKHRAFCEELCMLDIEVYELAMYNRLLVIEEMLERNCIKPEDFQAFYDDFHSEANQYFIRKVRDNWTASDWETHSQKLSVYRGADKSYDLS